MSKKFKPEQFSSYTKLKAPSVGAYFLASIVGSLILSIMLIVLVGSSPDNAVSEGIISIFSFVALIALPLSLGVIWFVRSRRFSDRKKLALAEVLEAIGFKSGLRSEMQNYPTLPSSIIHNIGSDLRSQYRIHAKFEGNIDHMPAECVLLDARSHTFYMYLHIALSDSYPHTVIDGKDSILQHHIPIKIGSVERIKPEGVLDEHFSIYARKDNGAEALYTLMPDILESIMEFGTAYSIEIIGNSLYIFSLPNQIEDSGSFANIFNLAHSLTEEFSQRARSRGIHRGQFRYNSDYANRRMDIQALTPYIQENSPSNSS